MRIMVFMNCDRLKRTPGANRCNIETLPSGRRLHRYHWTLCVLAWGYIAASAQATMTTIKFQPNSADINDLDHRLAIHGGSMVSARALLRPPALRYHSDAQWPRQAGSADTFLANSLFTTGDYAFDFPVSHHHALAAPMASGSVGGGARRATIFQRRHQV